MNVAAELLLIPPPLPRTRLAWQVWCLYEHACVFTLRDIHKPLATVWAVTPSKTHGGRLSTCGGDGSVKLWKWSKGALKPVVESGSSGKSAFWRDDHRQSRVARVSVVRGAQQSVHDAAVSAFVQEIDAMSEAERAKLSTSATVIQNAWRKKKAGKMAVALVTQVANEEKEAEAAAAAVPAGRGTPSGAPRMATPSQVSRPEAHLSHASGGVSRRTSASRALFSSESENASAVKIQAAWRGKQARKRLASNKAAVAAAAAAGKPSAAAPMTAAHTRLATHLKEQLLAPVPLAPPGGGTAATLQGGDAHENECATKIQAAWRGRQVCV